MNRRFVPLAILTVACLPAAGRADGPWFEEFDEALAAAKRDGKDLLIDFGGSDWCAPCKWLKSRILTKPEFVRKAQDQFVLLDIDILHRTPLPGDRKKRYEGLQKRYGIEIFPSLLLATPDGKPYARATYVPSVTTPDAYWDLLQPLRQRGRELRAALAKAGRAKGAARADALAEGLAAVPADFVPRFWDDTLQELRRIDPADRTGYLAYIDGRRALSALQRAVEDKGLDAVSTADVDAVIAAHKPRGETLQDALLLRALLQVKAGRPGEAVAAVARLLDAQKGRGKFDRGDFIPLDTAAGERVAAQVARAAKDPNDRRAQYHALHRIFEFELPDPYEICCGHGYRPKFLAREPIGAAYGQLLIDSTANLRGEERAKALGDGLKDTEFYRQGPVAEIIDRIVPDCVGRANAARFLPPPYANWVR
jgi:thiol-disulfide isomerase/thioredoxin